MSFGMNIEQIGCETDLCEITCFGLNMKHFVDLENEAKFCIHNFRIWSKRVVSSWWRNTDFNLRECVQKKHRMLWTTDCLWYRYCLCIWSTDYQKCCILQVHVWKILIRLLICHCHHFHILSMGTLMYGYRSLHMNLFKCASKRTINHLTQIKVWKFEIW